MARRRLPVLWKAHGLAGLALQLLIEIDAVFMQLADRVAHVEERQQTGGMPGRAVREIHLLEQHRVGPALLGQVIEDADADDAAADDDHTGVGFHEVRSRFLLPTAWGETA